MKRDIDTDDGGIIPVEVTTIFGVKTQRGLVELRFGDTRVQMTVGKAKEVRDMLTAGIEAAISDELLVKFLMTEIGIPITNVGAALAVFREMRQGTRGLQRIDG